MSLKRIRNVNEVVELYNSTTKEGSLFIFRGVSCEAYPLFPRIEWDEKANKAAEQGNFNDFKKSLENQGYFKQDFIHNDFRTLGLAQHYQRFPTRLLDWTSCILIALYFVCKNKKKHNQDGAIWCFPLPLDSNDSIWLTPREESVMSPFNLDQFKIFICGSFIDDFKMRLPKKDGRKAFGNSRDIKQQSIMTLHPKNKAGKFGNLEDLKQKYGLEKILVPKGCKKTILNDLSKDPWRITRNTLFYGVSARALKSKDILSDIVAKNLKVYDRRALINL
ncbi:MAG: FRG domain-containing protein [Candidatus Omnitrophica bacterium]|nr:FRG domain-containing protein [Candidatus Omnitrophota bacterium]